MGIEYVPLIHGFQEMKLIHVPLEVSKDDQSRIFINQKKMCRKFSGAKSRVLKNVFENLVKLNVERTIVTL